MFQENHDIKLNTCILCWLFLWSRRMTERTKPAEGWIKQLVYTCIVNRHSSSYKQPHCFKRLVVFVRSVLQYPIQPIQKVLLHSAICIFNISVYIKLRLLVHRFLPSLWFFIFSETAEHIWTNLVCSKYWEFFFYWMTQKWKGSFLGLFGGGGGSGFWFF